MTADVDNVVDAATDPVEALMITTCSITGKLREKIKSASIINHEMGGHAGRTGPRELT